MLTKFVNNNEDNNIPTEAVECIVYIVSTGLSGLLYSWRLESVGVLLGKYAIVVHCGLIKDPDRKPCTLANKQ